MTELDARNHRVLKLRAYILNDQASIRAVSVTSIVPLPRVPRLL